MQTKTVRFDLKSLTEEGEFEGYASVFGNVDSDREIVRPGAFKRTLEHWREKRKPIPILLQHDTSAIPIGTTTDAHEDERGLRVKGKLLLGVQRAREAYEALKAGVLTGLSIGYSVVKDSTEDDGTRNLEELRLWEWSLVTFPANTEAGVTAVKQRDLEQRLSALEDRLKSLQANAGASDDSAGGRSSGIAAATDGDSTPSPAELELRASVRAWLHNRE